MRFDAQCLGSFHQSTAWGSCQQCGGTWKTRHLDREPQPGDGPEYRDNHDAWKRRQPSSPTPPAIVRAGIALVELRTAMDDVRTTLPGHMPGEGPTAADNCQEILKMMDWNIRQVAAYLGLDRAEAQ